jgi:serine/threonine protein kinase
MVIIGAVTDRSIAHYNLLERIGEEGLGTVYRARDTRLGRTVALKVLPPELVADRARVDALVDDALAAAALSHPNIATLFEAGNSDGVRYLAYEFVSGAPLAATLAGVPMNPRRAVELASQVADALAAMHAAGLFHGDLSPATIAVTDKGAAKLLDCGMQRWTFGGAARRAAAINAAGLDAEAMTAVTCMAPEQALGEGLDSRADIFSLGTVLYLMLTGTNPFAAASAQDALINVISLQPSPASTVNPVVPPELDAVVARAMSKDINNRYESAAAFAAELRRSAATLDQLPEDEAAGFMLPVDDSVDKVPSAVWLAVGAGLAGVAGIAWWSFR